METWTKDIKWGGAVLFRTTQEKDVVVKFSDDMKVSEQSGLLLRKEIKLYG